MKMIVIHATASGAPQTAKELATSDRFNNGSSASCHYINDRDGSVTQIVQETDSAWANGVITGPEAPAGVYPTPGKGDYHLHGLDPNHNYNHDTISIENIKYSTDNSEPLTDAQYKSLVALVADICRRRNIIPTQDTLVGHYVFDPVNRARCPGNFDWPTFRADVSKALSGGNAVQLSASGEVADFLDADQFQPAKTQAACGFFSVALMDVAAPVGHPPTKSAAGVIAEAEAWYAQYDGSNAISNFQGMVQSQLHQLLGQIGLKYQDIGVSVDAVRSSVRSGTPVIICSVEDSYFDMALGDKVPYYWNGSGFNHIITVTGIAPDGNFLVRDPANVTDLNNPNSLRPGPRKYDASKVQLLWATAVQVRQPAPPPPPPAPKPAPAPPPPPPVQQGSDMLQISDPFAQVYFKELSPTQWQCKNGGMIVQGAILNYFRLIGGAVRLPQTPEMHTIPNVVWQRFESGIIVYDPKHTLDHPITVGDGNTYVAKLDSDLAKSILMKPYVDATNAAVKSAASAQSQVKDLQAQVASLVAQLKSASGPDQAAIKNAIAAAQALVNALSAFVKK